MLRRWLLLVVALLPLLALWALVNPPLAAPDENAHVVKTQSVARGDFSSPYTTDGIPVESILCFRFESETTAACQDLTWGEEGRQVSMPTRDYPPVFHLLASPPALISSGLAGFYALRLWVVVITVAMVAWAGALVSRRGLGVWPLAGLLLAMTPLVVHLGATISPSAFAFAGSALYVAALISSPLISQRSAGRPKMAPGAAGVSTTHLVIAAAVGGAALGLTRRDGLLWLVLVTLALTPLMPWRAVRDRLRHRTSAVTIAIASVVAVLVGIAAVAWFLPTLNRFLSNRSDGLGDGAWDGARRLRWYLFQLAGQLGWIDSPISDETFTVIAAVVGTVLVLAFVLGLRRWSLATAIAALLMLAVPVAFTTFRAEYFQGRYLFPIWVALMMLAGSAIASAVPWRPASGSTVTRHDGSLEGMQHRLGDRLMVILPRVLLGIWVVVQAAAYLQNLRRYAVGRSGSWAFVREAEWHPPTMSNAVAVVALVVALACATVAVRRLVIDIEREQS